MVFPEETVPCRVQYKERRYTDVVWGLLNIAVYISYLATGIYVVTLSKPRHTTLPDGSRGLSEFYMEDAATCCANTNNGYVCSIYEETLNNGGRRLAAGLSKFDGDEGIFDAFLEAPLIIAGLLSIVLGVSIIWIILLRFFAKPIVILVEIIKIGIVIAVGVYQQDTRTQIWCFVIAALMLAFAIWQRKNIIFASKMIKHSTVSLKENPSILAGSLFTKLLYAGNAALFVLFFAKSFDAVQIKQIDIEGYYNYSYCDFVYPGYIQNIGIFWSLAYLWTILLFDQMRLSIIASICGSWHFHPEDKPTVFKAITNVIKSFGTISVSSLIATIAEKVNRMMSQDAWMSWISPTICITWPFHCFMCIFGTCIHTCVKMLTGYAVVLHTFTGANFIGSARNSFKILSRHFQGGFVTDITSRSVFTLASYAFSFCIALIAWVWIDAEFSAGSLPQESTGYLWILWFVVILFNVYYPVLGLYVLIIANKFLRDYERSNLTLYLESGGQQGTMPTNHFWIPPLAGTFVGCIAMMFFTFISHMFLDIITTLFLCFAIDKDNNVDLKGQEFESLVKEMPGYLGDKFDDKDPEQAEAIPVKTY